MQKSCWVGRRHFLRAVNQAGRSSLTAGILQKSSAEEDERIPALLQARMTQRERHGVAPWVE